jgi:hypothetical protein
LRILAVSLLAAAALAAVPATSVAGEQVVRPASTHVAGTWLIAGFTTPWGALNDDIAAPAAPDVAWDYLYSYGAGPLTTEVGLAAPVIPATSTVTGTTGHVYLGAGSARPVTVELRSGNAVLASATAPAGQPRGWITLSPVAVPTAGQLADLRLRVLSDGPKQSTAAHVYAAYAAITTDDPAADPADPQTSTPTTDDDPQSGDDATSGGGDEDEGAPVSVPVTTIPMAASGVLSVPVTCQITGGCAGTVSVELMDSAARSARRRKARVTRFRLRTGQSKKVAVKLDRRSARVVRGKGRARVKLTIAVDGQAPVTKQVTVLERRRPARPKGPTGHSGRPGRGGRNGRGARTR